jgi:hypothetical protein
VQMHISEETRLGAVTSEFEFKRGAPGKSAKVGRTTKKGLGRSEAGRVVLSIGCETGDPVQS